MAVPAYSTDLTDITTDFSTNWNLVTEGGGGSNSLTAPETDDYIQGTEAVSRNPFSTSIRGVAYDRATITVGTDDAVFHWWKVDVAAALDSFANGGVHLLQGSSLTVYKKFYVAGNDTYQLGGWRCTPIDPTATPSASRGTEPSPDFLTFGVAFDVPASGPSKGFPFKADMIRHGRQVEVTAGEVANPATWGTFSDYADADARRWGILQGTDTGASLQGIAVWGTATTAVYSRDSNKTIVLLDTLGFTTTDFTQIQFSHASNDIEWDNIGLVALGTLNRGIIDVTADGAVAWKNSVFQGIDITTMLASSVFDGSTWIGTNEVDSGGGSLLGASILVPTVAADSYSLLWNVAADPDGELDGMVFSMGANSHHAIEFGTSVPTSMTLRDIDFTGFGAADDANDSTFNFLDTAGTITLNLVGCTGNVSVKAPVGLTVIVVNDPVTVTAKAVTVAGVGIEDARVHLEAVDGYLPVADVVTIVNSGTTATVTHTAHGLVTGDKVVIRAASLDANNGVFSITETGVNTYTYTMASTPGSSPTGTITSTFVILYGLTDVNGEISTGRVFSSDQPMTGRARKSSPGDNPLYKNTVLTGTVDSTAGATFVGVMIED